MTGSFRIHMVRIYPVSRPLVFSRCLLLSGHDFSLRLRPFSMCRMNPVPHRFRLFYICRDVDNGGIHPLSSTLRHNISIVLNFLSNSSKFRQLFQIVKSLRSKTVRARAPWSMAVKESPPHAVCGSDSFVSMGTISFPVFSLRSGMEGRFIL